MSREEKYFINPNLDLSKVFTKDDSGYEYIEFLENSEPIAPLVDGVEFTDKDFKNRIKQAVSDFVNQSFENIVVLAGAGASVVVDESGINKSYGKTMTMIAENIDLQLKSDEELSTLQELAKESKYDIPVRVENVFNTEFNLEDFLSNLLSYENFFVGNDEEKNKFLDSKNRILEIIKSDTSYSFEDRKMKHDTFLKILSQKVKAPNKVTIITTNYDTVFEEAGEKLGFTIMDGFTFSAYPFFDSDMFEWNLVKDIPNVRTKELEYKPNIVNLLKIHGSLTWERSESGKRIRRRNKDVVKKPIMVFPSSNKYAQSYEEPYFALFTKFQELLKRPNTLFITTGFSFADNHISKMITGAIKNNHGLAVLISDFNIEQKHTNWKELDKLRDNHFRIAFLKSTLNSDLTDFLGGKNDYR